MENKETVKSRITAESVLVQPQAKKNQEKLTIEELRSCKGFETISESEGQEIIESLFQLAVIVYNF
jgi:hypothetical protein